MKHLFCISSISLLTLIFTGCNDTHPPVDHQVQTSVEPLQNPPTDPSRLEIYRTRPATIRVQTASEGVIIPEVPANVKTMYGPGESWKVKEGDTYILKAGETFSSELRFNNNDYYVYGELTLNQQWVEKGGTIYIMPEGKVNITGSVLENKVTIVNTGKLLLPATLTVNQQAGVYTNTDLDAGTINVSGKLYSEAAVSAKNIHLNTTGLMTIKGCLVVSNTAIVTNSASLQVGSFLAAQYIDLSAAGSLVLGSGSHISCNVLAVNNQTAHLKNEGNDYAVIACNELIIHQADQTKNTGWLDIHAKTITNKTSADIKWLSTVVFDGDTYIAPGECAPGFGKPSDKAPVYKLDHIAKVNSAKERISATSIGFKQGKAYVSWHKYGEPFEGYIDVLDMGTLQLDATLHSETLDFNHIYVDDTYIYVAGGKKAGAFIGKIEHDGSSAIDIKLTSLNGSSGNCVLAHGEKLWAVSGANGGLSILDGSNLNYQELPYAKYVLKQGDNMVVLSDAEQAKLSCFDLTGSKINEYQVGGSITPTDGKNAMATDGETVYIALGGNGVKAMKNGTVVAEFSNENNTGGFANGIDVDDKFVYVANGNGLYILNKTDLSEIISYHLAGASANFVKKGDDGLLYVSYGLNGVNVFRLIEE